MHNLCRLNKLSNVTKSRLITSGVLNDKYSTDINFLRLRFSYMQAAMFTVAYDGKIKNFTRLTFAALLDMCENRSFLLTGKSISELSGLLPKHFESIIRTLNIMPIPNTLLRTPDSLFENMDATFYSSHDIVKVCKYLLTLPKADLARKLSKTIINERRIVTGLNIEHPEGKTGATRSLAVYAAECKKLLDNANSQNTSNANQNTPAVIDYDTLEWNKVLAHPNFDLLRTLVDCSDNSYLRQYMSASTDAANAQNSPQAAKLLTTLAEAATTHKRSTHPSTAAETVHNVHTKTVADEADAQQQARLAEHFTTIYQLVDHHVTVEDAQIVDFAAMHKRFNGALYTPSPVKQEFQKLLKTIEGFETKSECGAQLYLKPSDLVTISGADINVRYPTAAGYKTMTEIVQGYLLKHATLSFADLDADPDNKVRLFSDPSVAEGKPMYLSYINIAKALRLFITYFDSIKPLDPLK